MLNVELNIPQVIVWLFPSWRCDCNPWDELWLYAHQASCSRRPELWVEEEGVSVASASREVKHQTVYKASFLLPAAH